MTPPPPPPEVAKPSLGRRALRFAGKFALGIAAGLGLTTVFVASFAGSAVLHLNLPVARRALGTTISDLASSDLRGRIEIKNIMHISPRDLDVGDVTIRDPNGNGVLTAYGAHVRYDVLSLGRAFLSGGKRVPTIDRVIVDRVNVALIDDGTGAPTIGSAFESKTGATKPGPPKEASTLRFAIASIDVGTVAVFGTAGGFPLDVNGAVKDVWLSIEPDATQLGIPSVRLAVAPIAGTLPDGARIDLRGTMRIPTVADARAMTPELRAMFVTIETSGIAATVQASLIDNDVRARVHVPEVTPTQLAHLLGGPPPITGPASVSVDVEGSLDRMAVYAIASLGEGRAIARGLVDLAALQAKPNAAMPRIALADVGVTVIGLEARAFAPTAPPITIATDLVLHATATMQGTEIAVVGRRLDAPTEEGPYDSKTWLEDPFKKGKGHKPTGAASIAANGVALVHPNGALEAKIDAQLALDDAHADVHLTTEQGTGKFLAAVEAHASVPALSQLPFGTLPIKGGVEVDLAGHVDLQGSTFTVTGQVRGRGLVADGASVPNVVVDLAASGPFAEPRFETKVTAPELFVGSGADRRKLHEIVVRAAGTPKIIAASVSLTTDKNQVVDVSTHVVPTATGARVAGLTGHLHRGKFAADLALREVVLDGSSIAIKGFRLASTAGGLRLDGTIDPRRHTFDVDAASTPLDIAGLAHGLGFDAGDLKGTVQVDAKLATLPASRREKLAQHAKLDGGLLRVDLDAPALPEQKKSPPNKMGGNAPMVVGRLKLEVKGVHTKEISQLDAQVDVGVEDQLVDGTVKVTVKDLVDVVLHGGVLSPGRFDDPKAWKRASGHVEVAIPSVDLAKVEAYLTKVSGPMTTHLAGKMALFGRFERRDADSAPTGWVTIESKGLDVMSGTTRIKGLEVRLRAALEGNEEATAQKSGKAMALFVVGEAYDKYGPLALVHVGTEATWETIVNFGSISKDVLAKLPIVAHVIVPPRKAALFPVFVRNQLPLDGTIGVNGKVEGTIGKPTLDLRAAIDDIRVARAPHLFAIQTTYDGVVATLHATFSSKGSNKEKTEKVLLTADGEVKIALTDVLAPTPGVALPWTAKLDAKIDQLPLRLFAPLSEMGIGGKLSGEVHVDHVNDPAAKAATVKSNLSVEKLGIGETKFETAKLDLDVGETKATATLSVNGKEGKIEGHASVPLTWASASSPSITKGAPVVAKLDVTALRLKMLEPFTQQVFDEIDGRLDAHIDASLTQKTVVDKSGKTTIAWDGAPKGTITVRDGVIVAAAVGERWEGVHTEIDISAGKIDLRKVVLQGRGGGGRAELTGSLTLDGFMPKALHAELYTKRFPFASEGVKIGELSGRVMVDGAMKARTEFGMTKQWFDIAVKVDPMTVDLAADSGKNPQSLDEDASIVVAQPLDKPKAPPDPKGSASMPIRVAVSIPNNVWIRRDDVRLAVTGNPTIAVDGAIKFTGEVKVDRGWVEVFGKRFVIDHAHIKFDGEEEMNPTLDVATKYDAPDGSIVTIAVTGRMKAPKVKMTSDPAASQAEIMSLLVLGRRDAGNAQQQNKADQGAAAQTAAMVQGMTGAIVGKQLQRALPTSMSLSFQPGSKGFADARYAGGYQFRKLYFEVAYNAGAAKGATQQGGQTQPRTTFGVEYRFHRLWSLMTTLGDTGSAWVDLLWNYRY